MVFSSPLLHYLLNCDTTSRLWERLPSQSQPGHPNAAAAAAVVRFASCPLSSLPCESTFLLDSHRALNKQSTVSSGGLLQASARFNQC